MQYFSIKNWEKHQHYKDRNPPWIKLHREVLDDYEITCLQDASRLLQILLWALASQLNNRIPHDLDWLQKRLNLNAKVNLTELIDKGFVLCEQDASTPQAKCSPETYREETETEKEKIYKKKFEVFWEIYPKQRKGSREKAEAAYRQAQKRSTAGEILAGLKAYIDSAEVSTGYAKGAAAWLNDDRWKHDYAYRPNGSGAPKEAMTLEETQKFIEELNK